MSEAAESVADESASNGSPATGQPASGEHGGTRATIAALTANLAIAITKLVAWLLTGAASMLSEAIHSFADTGNQILLLIGGHQAKKQANRAHPFGYGRQRYINAFLVAVILFSVGGLFALYEAIRKIGDVAHGEENQLLSSQWWWVPLAVLGVSLIAEGLSLRTAMRETHEARQRHRGVIAFVRRSRSPELPVVMLEDSAALIGLVFALLGVGLTLITGNGLFDVIGSGMIGLLLIAVAVLLGVEMQSLLLGESAMPEVEDAIVAALDQTPGVRGVIHLKTVHVGPEQIMVAAKIDVASSESAEQLADTIDAAEVNIRTAEPMCRYIYLEPDIRDEDYHPARPTTA
ncbi:Cation diffusion facilitator family transporter [Propionibacterium freudenreichii]|uniref:Cation diffusion facilitator family transporter n=1 Tax=Propionibacterium freudenreichii TaxID=1744 RepID=A0A509MI12_9ACTN|nr:cation diffusion facilitator family transporter [Propionibacterium freudenreichii]SCQ79992.1 Cation diffusion facilitator family transporter [Propionibacterium freudenreichii]